MPDMPTSISLLLQWAPAIAITLLVLDLFFNTELISWLALICMAAWGTYLTGPAWEWSVLVFIIYLGVSIAFYYALWVSFVRPCVAKTLLRNAAPEDDELMVGRHGTVVGEGEAMHLRIADELWPVDEASRSGLKPGDQATVTGYRNGVVSASADKA